jgi:hypothetical protein
MRTLSWPLTLRLLRRGRRGVRGGFCDRGLWTLQTILRQSVLFDAMLLHRILCVTRATRAGKRITRVESERSRRLTITRPC